MRVIKSNKRIAEEEAERDIKEKKVKKTLDNKHSSWKASRHFDYVMEVLDREIEATNDNSAIPTSTFEEMGQYSLSMKIAQSKLKNIKKTLSRDV